MLRGYISISLGKQNLYFMASFSFIVPMCVDAEVSKQSSAPEEVCLPLFLLPFHSHTFLLLLTCALLAWPHHTKEGGCIQELKPAAADTRAKGRGRLIHRRLWRRCSRRWLAQHDWANCQKPAKYSTRKIRGIDGS